MVEAAAWLVDELDEFRIQRKAELKQTPAFQDSDCFHDGSTLLNSVKQYIHHIPGSLAVGDKLTEPLLDMVCEQMLQAEPSMRIPAGFALQHASNLLEKQEISMRAAKKKEAVYTEDFTNSPPQIESRTPVELAVDPAPLPPRLSDEFRSNKNLGNLETTTFGPPRAVDNLVVPDETLTSGDVTQPPQPPKPPKWSVKEALKWKMDLKMGIGPSTLPFESFYVDLRDRDFVSFSSMDRVTSVC
jgi:hypothetical protein